MYYVDFRILYHFIGPPGSYNILQDFDKRFGKFTIASIFTCKGKKNLWRKRAWVFAESVLPDLGPFCNSKSCYFWPKKASICDSTAKIWWENVKVFKTSWGEVMRSLGTLWKMVSLKLITNLERKKKSCWPKANKIFRWWVLKMFCTKLKNES